MLAHTLFLLIMVSGILFQLKDLRACLGWGMALRGLKIEEWSGGGGGAEDDELPAKQEGRAVVNDAVV